MFFANDADKKIIKKYTLQVLQDKESFDRCVTQRASQSPSMLGSITVEAAILIPLFLFVMCSLLSFCEVLITKEKVHQALVETVGVQAQCAYFTMEKAVEEKRTSTKVETAGLLTLAARGELNYFLSSSRLCHVVGGNNGIVVNGIGQLDKQENISGSACYAMKISIPFFPSFTYPVKEVVVQKAMTGAVYQENQDALDQKVYITEHGSVYHTSAQCAYLEVKPYEITDSRQINRYSRCKLCNRKGKEKGGGHYVTEYGDSVHSTLACSSLCRSVRCVSKKEVGGKPLCSKCQKRKESGN